jgi:hypothetical protein
MEMGVTRTLLQAVRSDPYHSLLALIDRDLRQRVVESNLRNPDRWHRA